VGGRSLVQFIRQNKVLRIRYGITHLYIYTSMKLGSFVWGTQKGNLFVLSENVHFSQQPQESGVIKRQSTSRCEWGWENGGLSYTWKEIIRSHFNEETPRRGKIFCPYFLLWFFCRFFILHSSPLQLCLHIILTSSSLSLSWALPLFISLWFWWNLHRFTAEEKKMNEKNWKSLPTFRLFFPASSFDLFLYTIICWMTQWPKI
jgi:hypothetical protein